MTGSVDDRCVEAVAMAIHRTWLRHGYRRYAELLDDALERRWREAGPSVRANFIAEALAAIAAFLEC